MKQRYVVILNYCDGEIIKIALTDKERKVADKYDNLESYLETLETEYGFRLKDCSWMVSETLKERAYFK